ncbi:MAG: hypothetical protein J6N93_06870, partial [Clostridia bacterium]|nr:hypothetical protein [Clostridia bacterium]
RLPIPTHRQINFKKANFRENFEMFSRFRKNLVVYRLLKTQYIVVFWRNPQKVAQLTVDFESRASANSTTPAKF